MKRWDRPGACMCSVLSVLAVLFIMSSALSGGPPEAPSPTPTAGPEEPVSLDRVIVTASRHEERLFDAPFYAEAVTFDQIQNERMSRTVPEVFADDPSILVQKTSRGQGSPFLRGFTGFRTLFLIDGIRLNNSTFREGPNQYWSTVDPFTVERLEVVKGPSSVLYGSDAIGGTVNAITRTHGDYQEGFDWDRRLYYRYDSADSSSVGRGELGGSYDNTVSFFGGASVKDFNDLRAGRGVGRQAKTGYDELDHDFKVGYLITPDDQIVVAHQRADQEDVWRTHSTVHGKSWHGTDVGTDLKRLLDQDRDLLYVQYHARQLAFFDAAHFSLSLQSQGEEEDRVKSDGKEEIARVNVQTPGFWAQFENDTSLGKLTYGAEYYRDSVDSMRRKYNADGTLSSVEIQGPVADNATYDLVGAYLQDEIGLTEDLDITPGVRYNYARADADKALDPVTKERIGISDQWDSVVGSLRFVYRATEKCNVFGGISQGFRAPNLSDLTRLDMARSSELETPSPDLKPEYFLSYELGTKLRFDRWTSQLSVFYTDIDDMIVRFPTGTVVGGLIEVQKANIGDGFIWGTEAEAEYRLTEDWSVWGALAWQHGDVDTFPTADQVKERRPLSRVLPLTGVVGLRWRPAEGWWIEPLAKMADKQNRLSPDDGRDTQRIPPGGTPGYAVYTIRAGVDLSDNLSFTAAIENITDVPYRIHGSGVNEPGRSIVASLSFKF